GGGGTGAAIRLEHHRREIWTHARVDPRSICRAGTGASRRARGVSLATSTTTLKPLYNEQLAKTGAGFFWLSAFYLVYCGRSEDWIHLLGYVPVAKITGIGAFLAFLSSGRSGQHKFRELPVEARYLLALLGVLLVASLTSPIWRGGSVSHTLDFSKVYLAWAL